MLLFQQGWRGAFDELVHRFKDSIVQFVYHLVRDGNLAQDIAQETLIAVYRSRETYQPVGLVRTWILAIARNQVYTHLRSRERHPDHFAPGGDDDPILEGLVGDSPVPSEKASMAEQLERVRSAIDELPHIYREIVYLRVFKELSYREIGDLLKVGESTLRTRMEFSLKYLRQKMKSRQ